MIRRLLLVYTLYAAAAVIITFPLVTQLGDVLLGIPFTDSTEYLRHIWWLRHTLATGGSLTHDPLLLYPNGIDPTLLLSIPLQSLPALLLSYLLPLPAAFNLAALLTLAANGTAMYSFISVMLAAEAQDRPRSSGAHHAALIAGLVFLAYPAFQGQLGLGHVGLVTLYPVPLLLTALLRLSRDPRPRDVLWGAFWFMLAGSGSLLLWVYVVAPALVVWLARLVWRRAWRSLRWTLVTLALGVALALPLALLALRGAGASAGLQSVQFSATPLNIAAPSFAHPLWGALDLGYPRRILGVDPFEHSAYIGVIAGVLALIGVWRGRGARLWLAVAALAWLLSLGALLKWDYDAPLTAVVDGYPTHISLPWALFERLPVLSVSRTPVRFNFAVGLAVAVMAGLGASALLAARRRTTALLATAALCGLIAFDYQTFFPMPTTSAAIPPIMRELAGRGDVRAVFNLPWEHPLTDKDGMYLQTAHQQPMIAGHITRHTPLNPAQGWLLQATLDPALLDAAGADVLIVHRDWDYGDGVLEARLRERFGAPFYADARVALFEPPAPDQPPALATYAQTDPTETRLYAYIPDAGTYTLTGTVEADGTRGAIIRLDAALIWAGALPDGGTLTLPLPFDAPGFYTVTVAADPPCLVPPHEALTCAALRIEGIDLQ